MAQGMIRAAHGEVPENVVNPEVLERAGLAVAVIELGAKDLNELSVAEIAILAGIPQRPADLNPIASPERAKVRRAYVLRRMHETGAITDAEYRTALAEPVVGKRFGTQTQLDAPYVAEMVRAEMIRRFGPAAYTAGLKVTTTVDSRLQRASNQAIHETLMAYDERHGFRGPLTNVALPPIPADGVLNEFLVRRGRLAARGGVPVIDSLAARGTRFTRFYVSSPVCMPNRATLVTGRMPSLHGVRHNGIELPLENVTMPELPQVESRAPVEVYLRMAQSLLLVP